MSIILKAFIINQYLNIKECNKNNRYKILKTSNIHLCKLH